MFLLRICLLSGLLFHKAVWEVMKHRNPVKSAPKRQTQRTRLISAVKVVILAALICQIFLPDVLPIMTDATVLRRLGVSMYALGLLLAVTARIQLGMNWSDIEKSRVVDGHELVARGVYSYIRHPIYTGDLILLAGFELALNSWLVAGVAVVALYVQKQAVREELTLGESLPGYDIYCRETGRFLPVIAKKRA